jgi:hypothetical protein
MYGTRVRVTHNKKSRWYGRGSKSCKSHADILRSECVAFQGYVKRAAALELSGNPTEGGLFPLRCLFVQQEAVRSGGYVWDCDGNRDTPEAGGFKYEKIYKYMLRRTTLK